MYSKYVNRGQYRCSRMCVTVSGISGGSTAEVMGNGIVVIGVSPCTRDGGSAHPAITVTDSATQSKPVREIHVGHKEPQEPHQVYSLVAARHGRPLLESRVEL